jgi:hypothetical protein
MNPTTLITFSFYTGENEGQRCLNALAQITQLLSLRNEIWAEIFVILILEFSDSIMC